MNNLVWLDMEMTGLDYLDHVILEVAIVITDDSLNILDQTPSYAIFQPDHELAKMDSWNCSTHKKSGLIDRVKESKYSAEEVETLLLDFIAPYTKKNESPICGNTIHQDRKFMLKFMPNLENYLHYRNIDISTIKELAKRWNPSIYNGFTKHNKHQALDDILESIEELKYYKKKFFILPII